MAPMPASGSCLNRRVSSTPESLDSQISRSSSPHLSLQSGPPDVRNWFSSYEYESPTQDSTLLGLEPESCAPQEVDGGGGMKTDMDKPPEASEDMEGYCLSTVEEKRVVLLIGEDHDGKKGITCKKTWNESCQATSLESSFDHFNEHYRFLATPGKRQIPNNSDEERNQFRPKSNRYSIEALKGNTQNQEEWSNRNDSNMISHSQLSMVERHLLDNDPILRNDCNQEKTIIAVSELLENKENSIESSSRWISTRRGQYCSGNERGLEKVVPLLKQKEAESTPKLCNISRKRDALVDHSNLVPGQWYCPRNSKPNLGPPLKQLRLELWVRRASSTT